MVYCPRFYVPCVISCAILCIHDHVYGTTRSYSVAIGVGVWACICMPADVHYCHILYNMPYCITTRVHVFPVCITDYRVVIAVLGIVPYIILYV